MARAVIVEEPDMRSSAASGSLALDASIGASMRAHRAVTAPVIGLVALQLVLIGLLSLLRDVSPEGLGVNASQLQITPPLVFELPEVAVGSLAAETPAHHTRARGVPVADKPSIPVVPDTAIAREQGSTAGVPPTATASPTALAASSKPPGHARPMPRQSRGLALGHAKAKGRQLANHDPRHRVHGHKAR